MKIRPVRAELFQADGWTKRYDGDNSCFPQFCESAQIPWALTRLQLAKLTKYPREIKVIQGAVYCVALMGKIADSCSLLQI